ncbi:MAG: hypothetical protein ACOX7C_08585 [Brevefilum sp.]|jgi:uncharacterized protein (DUF983 family)
MIENKNGLHPTETPSDHAGKRDVGCNQTPTPSLRYGMICPHCHAGKIGYDGFLNLVCPNCGIKETGAFT